MMVKNAFIFLLVKFASLFKRKLNPKKVLIVSTTGLGDSVWATPVIDRLKEAHPDTHFYLLTNSLGKEALFHNPHLEDVFVLTYQPLLKLWWLLWRECFHSILIFHASQRIVFPLVLTLGAKVISTKGQNKGLDSLLQTTPIHSEHEIERRMRIARTLGPLEAAGPLHIVTTQEEEEEANTFLRLNGYDPSLPLILLQPFAKDPFKWWPEGYFVNVARQLKGLILVTGGPNEARKVKAIARKIDGAIPLVGQLSLRVLICLLKKASLLITNDTGVMHLGFSQQTPTIALFSPTHPKFCGPYHANNAHVIYHPRSCTPCLKKRCHDPFCMRQISVDEVLKKAKSILEAR